jgi:hypothetical protein
LPIAIGQLLASIETLSLKDDFNDDGYLRGVSALGTVEGTIRHRLAQVLDHPKTPKVLAGATLAASLGLAIGTGRRRTQITCAAVIAISNRLGEIRTPYGRDGADQMSGVITQYRTLTALIPDAQVADDLFLRAVNIQAGLSYTISGVSKAFGSSWLQGDALFQVLQTEAYGQGPGAVLLRRFPTLCRVLTVGTVVWESSFPLVYVLPRHAPVLLAAAKAFHLGVAVTMELPRFVWGFFGAHGAVEYAVDSRGASRSFEKVSLGIATGLVALSARLAKEKRDVAREQRVGQKGSSQLQLDSGVVEYVVDRSTVGDSRPSTTFVLECGLGQPLESWDWVVKQLMRRGTVVRYHRSGYGLSDASGSGSDILHRLLEETQIEDELVLISHSIGSLFAAAHLRDPRLRERVSAIVLIDGTDPELLEMDRSDKRRAGAFVQAQGHTLFAALSGIYQWAPNAVERQVAYIPDVQYAHVHFVFTPRNIINALREYRASSTADVLEDLSMAGRVLVIGSAENHVQQRSLAGKIGADFDMVPGSSHRSILGGQTHARAVVQSIERFLRA